MTSVIDFGAGYALAADLVVFRRNETTVQIGTEAPRRVLIADAPAHAVEVLSRLRDTPTLAAAIDELGGDGTDWQRLFENLLACGLLEPNASADRCPPRLAGERGALTHRVGPSAAGRILASRGDAIVIVEGGGGLADTVSWLLDAAGIGRVHQLPGQLGAMAASPFGPRVMAPRHSPRVRYRPPAAQVKPTLIVLTGEPSQGRLAALTMSVTPHLPVRVATSRATVGPLVLPGASTCLNCVEQHRLDADPEWRSVSIAAADTPRHPAPILQHQAATLAAAEALDFVDGLRRPASVGATIEFVAGGIQPARRAWPQHDRCRCRTLAATPR